MSSVSKSIFLCKMTFMILAFNQINSSAVAVIFAQEKIISIHEWNSKETRDLLVNLINTIEKAKITPSELKGVFMINGPGNFTPVRISCVIANTFAQELKIPLYEISSLDFEQYQEKNPDLKNTELLVKIFNEVELPQKQFVESRFDKDLEIVIKK